MEFENAIASIADSFQILTNHNAMLANYNAKIASKICNINTLIYSNDIIIDLKFYREVYSDLSHMTDDELVCHYQTYGRKERRLSCEVLFDYMYPDFNATYYLNFYPDLQNRGWFPKNLKAHFFQHGRYEKRVCYESDIHHP